MDIVGLGGMSSGVFPLLAVVCEAGDSVISRFTSDKAQHSGTLLAASGSAVVCSGSAMVAGGCVVDSVGPTTETFSVEGRDVGEPAMVKVRFNQYHMYISHGVII